MFHDNEPTQLSQVVLSNIDVLIDDNGNSKQARDDEFVLENYGAILGRALESTEGDANESS